MFLLFDTVYKNFPSLVIKLLKKVVKSGKNASHKRALHISPNKVVRVKCKIYICWFGAYSIKYTDSSPVEESGGSDNQSKANSADIFSDNESAFPNYQW